MLAMKINVGIKVGKDFLLMNDQLPAIARWLNKRYQSPLHLPRNGTQLKRYGLQIVERTSHDSEINVVVERIPA